MQMFVILRLGKVWDGKVMFFIGFGRFFNARGHQSFQTISFHHLKETL